MAQIGAWRHVSGKRDSHVVHCLMHSMPKKMKGRGCKGGTAAWQTYLLLASFEGPNEEEKNL
jgi:hypothetical protein